MSHPLFSILIAQYNNGKYFEDCYNSILAQTYPNWEVIIVDDCSSDDSWNIMSKIIGKDQRFKIYKNETNGGCGFTKRRCVELANGSICGFLDPDDAILPQAIDVMVQVHLSNEKVALAYSNYYICNENLTTKSVKKSHQVENVRKNFFNFNGIISHFASFKKDYYNQTAGIHPFLRRAVDQDLYLKLYEVGSVFYIDEDLYKYRIHADGISTNQNVEKAFFWHWKVILDAAERRNVNVEDLFLQKFVRKDQYINLYNELASIKNNKIFKVLKKLKITEFVKYF
ncbi:MAG: glycosyltransferase [Weeksellaceae bacterium]|nr:glycosyltransferase [Weeksellaceae bacterium]